MKFKRLERVWIKKTNDFGIIGKIYNKNKIIVRPEGASFTYNLKEKDLCFENCEV